GRSRSGLARSRAVRPPRRWESSSGTDTTRTARRTASAPAGPRVAPRRRSACAPRRRTRNAARTDSLGDWRTALQAFAELLPALAACLKRTQRRQVQLHVRIERQTLDDALNAVARIAVEHHPQAGWGTGPV